MSVEQISQVWKHEFDHNEQAVMLALADHAHDDGTEIRPGVGRLAWKTGYSERQIKRILGKLRDDLKILVLTKKGDGRGKPNVYKFDWSKGVRKSPFTPTLKGDKSNIKGDISDTKGDTITSPEPSLEPSLEPSVIPTGSTESVEEVEAIPSNQYYVTQIYDRVKEQHNGVSLRPNQFGFHLSQMDRMLKQYEPTDEEVERVIDRIVDKLPSQPKIDALSAIQDVRFGRDTGEAWANPAPWESVNPHSDEGEKAKNKPYPVEWYASVYELSTEEVNDMLVVNDTHAQMLDNIESYRG